MADGAAGPPDALSSVRTLLKALQKSREDAENIDDRRGLSESTRARLRQEEEDKLVLMKHILRRLAAERSGSCVPLKREE